MKESNNKIRNETPDLHGGSEVVGSIKRKAIILDVLHSTHNNTTIIIYN